MAEGRLLRAAVQLPRDPLLRHRRPGHRRQEQGHDQPCGKIRIPINEEGKDKPGQIQEYLDMYQGRGHPAHRHGLGQPLRHGGRAAPSGVRLLDTPDTYYELVESASRPRRSRRALRERKILIDGKKDALLLQIFSENQLGPIFFEFIQRKGTGGFGNGNFKALFESIELDQIRRGVLRLRPA